MADNHNNNDNNDNNIAHNINNQRENRYFRKFRFFFNRVRVLVELESYKVCAGCREGRSSLHRECELSLQEKISMFADDVINRQYKKPQLIFLLRIILRSLTAQVTIGKKSLRAQPFIIDFNKFKKNTLFI